MTTKKQSKTPRPKILFGKAMGHNLYETPGADEIAWLCIPLTPAGRRKMIEAMANEAFPVIPRKFSITTIEVMEHALTALTALEKLANTPKG